MSNMNIEHELNFHLQQLLKFFLWHGVNGKRSNMRTEYTQYTFQREFKWHSTYSQETGIDNVHCFVFPLSSRLQYWPKVWKRIRHSFYTVILTMALHESIKKFH